MRSKTVCCTALIVALVYLASHAAASTTTSRTPTSRYSGHHHVNRLTSGSTGGRSRTKRLIDLTATAIAHIVDASIPRQARANWPAFGLDNAETLKV